MAIKVHWHFVWASSHCRWVMTIAELSKKGGTRWIITIWTIIHPYGSTRASRAAWEWHTDKGQTKDVTLSCFNFIRAWVVVATVIWALNSFRSAGFSDIDSLNRKKKSRKVGYQCVRFKWPMPGLVPGQNLNESLKPSRFPFSALVIFLQEVGS